MKNLLILTFHLITGLFLSECKQYSYKENYLDVSLDHFSYTSNVTFKMRYLINSTYDENGRGPILFYTGNEGDIELFAQNTGFMWEIAEKLNALVVFAEHRYYGKSLPFGNKSYDGPEHLGYLTSEQALGDYACLVQAINKDNARPVIAIGGSYGGMLSAWFRMKYPHIVEGALAASAPIFQFTGLTDCNIFSRIVTSVFTSSYSANCSSNIQRSWKTLQDLSTSEGGRQQINSIFKFCNNLTKADDIDKFFEYLEDVYGNLAMANYPYDNDFLAPLPQYPVRAFCAQLANSYQGLNLIMALQTALNIYSNYTGTKKCLDYNSAYEPSLGSHGWEFQSCTEMVMPMCSGKSHDMFRKKEWIFNKFSDDCYKKFNVRPREREVIITYGGHNLETASNIIFSNGLLDPWSGGGVLRTTNNDIYIIIIPEGAHHLDLRKANENDPESVRAARANELALFEMWIKHFYNNKL